MNDPAVLREMPDLAASHLGKIGTVCFPSARVSNAYLISCYEDEFARPRARGHRAWPQPHRSGMIPERCKTMSGHQCDHD